MPSTSGTNRPARTLLEQLIHERNQTLEEFAAYAETFAREHNEPGTLSAGHLQRLVAGRRYDGKPLGRLRPATARLLERIFETDIGALLSPLRARLADDSASELEDRLQASEKVDFSVLELLYGQLDSIRRLDRQLGANVAYDEVQVKISQVKRLLSYSLQSTVRARLAALLAELCMLAGWQALDLRDATESWQYYEMAKYAGKECGSVAFEMHTCAQHAFVLIDVNRSAAAADLLANVRAKATASSSVLRAWLAAAHGEALAANGDQLESLRAFDDAATLLPTNVAVMGDEPYVVLDAVHLDRWRGHALARLGRADAVWTLFTALSRLNPSFTRAETALRVDLATALYALGEQHEARSHARQADRLAQVIGSARQQRRVRDLRGRETLV